MVDPAVVRRFSAGAARYEAHAHAQRLSARDLLAYTGASLGPAQPGNILEPAPNRGPAFKILEPGCGTGLYTRMLLDAFPAASILGVDVSEAMIRVARKRIDDQGRSSAATGGDAPGLVVAADDPRARFAVADAEEITTGRYDLVTSNAAFQWFLSFPRTLARMASLLSGGGVLTFSFFGPETYAELDAALRAAGRRREAENEVRVAAAGFHSRDEIAEALSTAFPRWDVSERRYRQDFATLGDLLRSIRYTGTRGGGARDSWSPGRLARVEEAYRELHGGIRATYQVFLCRGAIPEGGPR